MTGKDRANELLEGVTFALECASNNDYNSAEYDTDGNLTALELRRGLFEEQVGTPFLEDYFRRVLSPRQSAALFALKDHRTPKQIEAAFKLILPPETALEAAVELGETDWEGVLRYLNGLFEIHRQVGNGAGDLIMKEREGFSSPFGSELESFVENRQPAYLDFFAARKYVDELRKLLPNIVKRGGALRLLPVSRNVPQNLREYLVEASRSYIYGHFRASLLLCWSAIEYAVRTRLCEMGCEQELKAITQDRLKELLVLARKRGGLDDTLWGQADEIRILRNRAAHPEGDPPSAQECQDAFIKTRGILQHVYE
jgi:hypothetical protein